MKRFLCDALGKQPIRQMTFGRCTYHYWSFDRNYNITDHQLAGSLAEHTDIIKVSYHLGVREF